MAKRKLYIIGAGDFGRELEMHLDRLPESDRDWTIAGYLDDNPDSLDGYPSDLQILGPISGFPFQSDDLAVLAIAKPSSKRNVYQRLRERVELMTYISPDAIVGKFTRMGIGCIIGPRVIIGPNVMLGDAVFVNSGSMVGHDVTIGSFCSFMANNNIAGKCRIGADAYFGSSVTVIPNRWVCDGALIGAGSVVVRSVTEQRTVFGNPARYL